jgi:hypothetical protein
MFFSYWSSISPDTTPILGEVAILPLRSLGHDGYFFALLRLLRGTVEKLKEALLRN